MKLAGLKEDTMDDFRVLFQEEFAQENLRRVRLLAPLCLFLITFAFGILPLILRLLCKNAEARQSFVEKVRKRDWYTPIYQAALCVSGGTLLAMVFAHLLPKIRPLIDSTEFFPGAEIYMSAGFVGTYLLQELLLTWLGNDRRDYRDQWHIYLVQFIFSKLKLCKHATPPRSPPVEKLEKEAEKGGDDLISLDDVYTLRDDLQLTLEEASELLTHVRADEKAPALLRTTYLRKMSNYLKISNPKMNWKLYFGVFFLCLHSVVDGFCLGLQTDEKLTWYVLFIIALHRIIIALATGVELLAANFKSGQIALVILIFSYTAPFGSLLSTSAANYGVGSHTLAGMIAMSGGSLLYVLFLELLRGNKSEYMYGIGNGIAVSCGWAISGCLYLWLKGNTFYLVYWTKGWFR